MTNNQNVKRHNAVTWREEAESPEAGGYQTIIITSEESGAEKGRKKALKKRNASTFS